MAYMPQRGFGRTHQGPNPVAVWVPAVVAPQAPVIPAPVAPVSNVGGGPVRNPYTTGQDYAYWVTQAYGAPGTATRNAVPMSCLMGGINCPSPSGVSGMGDYDRTGDYSWMFNPPPFNFLNEAGVNPPPEMYAPAASMGLGCAGKPCGSCACNRARGMGQATGLLGTTLFESTDFTQWGWGEYAVIAGGVYLLYSLTSDVKSVQRSVKRSGTRSRNRRKKELRDEADSL